MSEFIRLEIDLKRCVGISECGKCAQVCPVNIFEAQGDWPRVVSESEDECIICEQCLEACAPDAIALHKLYED